MIATIGLAFTLVVAAQSSGPEPAHYYVALNGQDGWTGKAATPNRDQTDGPFFSLERARNELRALKRAQGLPAGGAIVEVRGGVYERKQPFELTAEDSGTSESPVIYQADPSEKVRLIGGRIVSGLKRATDPTVLNRLDESARGKVLQADLRALGIINFGPVTGGGLELFFQDKPMTLARWPDEGFVKIVDCLVRSHSPTFTAPRAIESGGLPTEVTEPTGGWARKTLGFLAGPSSGPPDARSGFHRPARAGLELAQTVP